MTWHPGDRVLMYTDGLSEAKNATGAFLPMEAVIARLREGSTERALDAVLDEVAAHVPKGRLGGHGLT